MPQKVALNGTQKEQHEELLSNLMDIRERLMLVDPYSLTVDQYIKWSEQVKQVSLAITAMENAILTGISEKYVQELPKINQAAAKLERDLYKLKAGNDAIASVNLALGTIFRIATLIA